MTRHDDPAHLPLPMPMPSRDDIDRDTDAAYDAWAEAQPEDELFTESEEREDGKRD